MNHSLLRMAGAYSRFFLQEERKQQNIAKSMLHGYQYKEFSLFNYLWQHKPILPIYRSWQQNEQIPNLVFKLNDLSQITKSIHKNEQQNYENSTKTIQYSANNGIQDRLVSSTLKSLKADTISVFDGHGGDKLSEYCANHIVDLTDSFLQQHLQSNEYINNIDKLIVDALKYAYNKLQNDFYRNVYTELAALGDRKIKNVGTCALTIVIYDKKVYVANCGDSQAILVSQNQNGQVTYIELNQRLSVNNPSQRQRMIKEFPNDSDIVVQQRFGSFYVKGRLQPTRTIGDYHLKYSQLFKGRGKFNGPYINAQPDIKIFPITNESKRIILGSDGVWDFLDKQVVAQASLRNNPHQQILQQTFTKIAQVHNKSIDEIMSVNAQQKRSFHDDISIAVVLLGNCNRSTANNISNNQKEVSA